jgi:hypothetical protein
MRNAIRTALVLGTLVTSTVSMADPAKKDAPAMKDAPKADAPKTDAKDAPKADAKTDEKKTDAKHDAKKDVKAPATK